MKRFFTILFLFATICCTAQVKNINIAYLGDSHCNGGFGLGDSNWINRTTRFFIDQGFTVNAYKFCAGGETIRSGMPGWYPGSISGRNIDAALAVNPDIIFMLYSGNHIANGIKQDTSKFCYLYIADTLNMLGKRWAFSSIGPRQTYYPGSNFDAYNTQADSLNAWLYTTFPGRVFNIWDTLRDKETNKPYSYLLRVDSLHYLSPGHERMWQMTVHDSRDIDSLLGYDKVRGANLSFNSEGIHFDGANLKYLDIYGSNDGQSFELISHNEFSKDNSYPVSGYDFIKIEAYNGRKKITVTKRVQ